jgi:hypothetical protein
MNKYNTMKASVHKPIYRPLIAAIIGLSASFASAATVLVDTEATIRSGANSSTDQSESSYIFIKYEAPTSSGASRKAYFQFDLTGENADLTQAATFTVTLASSRAQGLQLWALDQAYTGFTSGATWDDAQANETGTNDLLTTGALTATKIGSVVEFNGSTGDDITFNLASLDPHVFGDKITLAISGVNWTGSGKPSSTVLSGGMRLQPGNSELEFAVVPEPSTTALLGLGGLALILRRRK